ncbi:MAG: alginate lyase family protein [Nitrosomonas sp.]|nr:MAG: alginate lyase family protein [Nitrosomonas sp.]
MTLEELLYRVVRHLSLLKMWIKMQIGYGLPFKKKQDPACYVFCHSNQSCLPDLPWRHEAIPAPQYYSMPAIRNWHEEPSTQQLWPVKFFARIHFSSGNPIGDIQLAWNRSRLQDLVTLGLAANLTNNSHTQHQLTQQIEAALQSWLDSNPWLFGIHYISTMECALRLISICHAFDLIRNNQVSTQAWQNLVYLVHSHAYFIRRRLCLYSYAGNHTIGECAGLIYAGVLFPEFPDANEWSLIGLCHMEREASIQILEDGGNREQSFRYLALIVDLCGLITMLLKHHNRPVPNVIEQAWQRGSAFLQAFASSPDYLPAVGDSDDGYALSPYLQLSWKNDNKIDHAPGYPLQIFSPSGYSKISGTVNHGMMRFSHGKLGIASGFGHGHADALSVCWDIDSQPILVDPGTYLYDKEPHFRHYFRGTAAHNTVVVDGRDQALQNHKTSFGWLQPYTANLVWHHQNFNGRIVLLANHNGYSDIEVLHWRALIYDHTIGWIVWDRIEGKGKHHLAMHWHIDAPLDLLAQRILIRQEENLWSIHFTGGTPRLYHGNADLPLGWIARKYGFREAINTIKIETEAHLPHEFLTIIRLIPENPKEFSINDELITVLRQKCTQ